MLSQRHGNKVKHLNRPQDQRKALLRSLTTELIRHGRITSTLAKRKEGKRSTTWWRLPRTARCTRWALGY